MAGDARKPTGDDERSADTEQRGDLVDRPAAFGAAAVEFRKRATRTAGVAILLIGGAIAMGETERLMTGALTPYGSSRSATDVIGLAALGGGDVWRVWLDLPDGLRRSVAVWLLSSSGTCCTRKSIHEVA